VAKGLGVICDQLQSGEHFRRPDLHGQTRLSCHSCCISLTVSRCEVAPVYLIRLASNELIGHYVSTILNIQRD
jgi:hypothetical protein